MVSDGGRSKTGTAHYYYVCKSIRKNKCDKKREIKNDLELYVAEQTRNFFTSKAFIEKVVDDIIVYYESKVDDSELKRVEVKITNTKKEIKDFTAAYVKAVAEGNQLLIDSCNERSKELAALLSDLENEYAKLSLEKVLMVTKKDLLDYIGEVASGDINDIEYQKYLIDHYVNAIFCYDDRTAIIFNVGDKNGKETVTKDDINEKVSSTESSVNDTSGGGTGI